MDQLDKTSHQITEAEAEIYNDLASSEQEGLSRIDNRSGKRSSIFDILSGVSADVSLENYEIVRRAADAKGDSDVLAAERSLRALLSARARLMEAKAVV